MSKRLTKLDLKRLRESHECGPVKPGVQLIFRGTAKHRENYMERGWLTNCEKYAHEVPTPGQVYSIGELTGRGVTLYEYLMNLSEGHWEDRTAGTHVEVAFADDD